MATKQATADYMLDQLSSLPEVRLRKMFGEYALYCNEKVVALICDDELFVKITDPGKKLLAENYEEGFPFPGAKAYIHVSADLLEDRKFFCELISQTETVLPRPKPKKKKISYNK